MIRAKDNNPTESVSNDVRKTHDIIKKSGQKIISVEYAGTRAFQRGIQDPRPAIQKSHLVQSLHPKTNPGTQNQYHPVQFLFQHPLD
mgnify:CR=1 FL=1